MDYSNCKVYNDGNHYIAIPNNFRLKSISLKNFKDNEDEIILDEEDLENDDCLDSSINKLDKVYDNNGREIKFNFLDNEEDITDFVDNIKVNKRKVFTELYRKYIDLKEKVRIEYIIEDMKCYFVDVERCRKFVLKCIKTYKINLIRRRVRLKRKANLGNFNYFCTFTYDNDLQNESTFRYRLRRTLKNFAVRRGWKYIGVWELSPEKERLHFHCLMKIPDGQMVGELVEKEDYSFKLHNMKKFVENTFFRKKFGRNEFDLIDDVDNSVSSCINYIVKYIEKSGERLVYSRGLAEYFISDILEEDILCPYGVGGRKMLLYDNFTCYDEGEEIGVVNEQIISAMPKVI